MENTRHYFCQVSAEGGWRRGLEGLMPPLRPSRPTVDGVCLSPCLTPPPPCPPSPGFCPSTTCTGQPLILFDSSHFVIMLLWRCGSGQNWTKMEVDGQIIPSASPCFLLSLWRQLVNEFETHHLQKSLAVSIGHNSLSVILSHYMMVDCLSLAIPLHSECNRFTLAGCGQFWAGLCPVDLPQPRSFVVFKFNVFIIILLLATVSVRGRFRHVINSTKCNLVFIKMPCLFDMHFKHIFFSLLCFIFLCRAYTCSQCINI